MNLKEKDVHYGKAVKNRLKEQGMTKAEFARRISRCRSDVYSIFKRQYIDLELLQTISKVLHYNFLRKIEKTK